MLFAYCKIRDIFLFSCNILLCRECGARVEKVKRFCRECGAKIDPGDKYCPKCVSKIDYSVQPNATDSGTNNIRTDEDGQAINEDELNEMIEELLSNCQGS